MSDQTGIGTFVPNSELKKNCLSLGNPYLENFKLLQDKRDRFSHILIHFINNYNNRDRDKVLSSPSCHILWIQFENTPFPHALILSILCIHATDCWSVHSLGHEVVKNQKFRKFAPTFFKTLKNWWRKKLIFLCPLIVPVLYAEYLIQSQADWKNLQKEADWFLIEI